MRFKRLFCLFMSQHKNKKTDLVKGTGDRFKGIKTKYRIEYTKNITTCAFKAIKVCSNKSRKILVEVYIL